MLNQHQWAWRGAKVLILPLDSCPIWFPASPFILARLSRTGLNSGTVTSQPPVPVIPVYLEPSPLAWVVLRKRVLASGSEFKSWEGDQESEGTEPAVEAANLRLPPNSTPRDSTAASAESNLSCPELSDSNKGLISV